MNLSYRGTLLFALGLLLVPALRLAAAPADADKVKAQLKLIWPMYRGDAARSNRGVGVAPFLDPLWRQSMFAGMHGAAAEERVRQAQKRIQGRREPIVSAFAPIALITQNGRGQKTPLLVCKTHFGLVALDRSKGQTVWLSTLSGSLQSMLDGGVHRTREIGERLESSPHTLFENSILGTLSSDGQFVYAINDLAVLPLTNGPVPLGVNAEVEDALKRNTLLAFSLDRNSGKLVWSLDGDENEALRAHLFLAPPLPLHDRLYVLVRKNRQVSLLCIDPLARRQVENQNVLGAKIVFKKPLVEIAASLVDDPLLRGQAAHLAYKSSVLVCPTNAGVVAGFDLSAKRVAWEYRYREKSEKAKKVAVPVLPPKRWKTTAPAIADDKVVLTPPDDAAIHCLKLCEGKRVWSRKKDDEDLYLGGVYDGKVLIVGVNRVRALNLADGETLWTRETGLPSGQGVAADGVYYLPLQRGAQSNQPEILALNIKDGQIRSRSKVRPAKAESAEYDVPGNLLFAEGTLISQSHWQIAAYPSLKIKLDDAKRRMERHPRDRAVRLDRANLLREAGRLTEAIEILRKTLSDNPDGATRRQARALLFETLTEWFQRDLRNAGGALKEYKDLTDVELGNSAEEELARRRLEQQRRLRSYHLLAARLRESQQRRPEAMQAYLDFAAVVPSKELFPLPKEPAVRVGVNVWTRGRIVELWNQATPPQRQQMNEDMDRRLKDIEKSKDMAKLRDFVDRISVKLAAGRAARLSFAQHVLAQGQTDRFLESELLLLPVSRQRADRVRAGRAVELLAHLMTAQNLLADAMYFYRILRRDFGKTELAGGKTGDDVWDDLASDKRFLSYLDEVDPFDVSRLAVRRQTGAFASTQTFYPFEHCGEAMPFFRRHDVGLDLKSNYFELQSRTNGRSAWTHILTPTAFKALLPEATIKAWPRFCYHTQGHLLVLPVENMVFGLDPIRRRVLWKRDTTAQLERSEARLVRIENDPRDGGPRLLHDDGWIQLPTCNLVLSPSVLCLATRTGLHGCDPRTGQILWTRDDLPRGLRLFGAEEHVFAVEENAKGVAVSTRVVRLADGASVPAPDFTDAFAERVQSHGCTLVVAHREGKDAVTLRFLDLPSGKILWTKSYPSRSLVLHSEDPRFTGVVEANGNVHILEVATGKEVLAAKMSKAGEHLRNVESIRLLADANHFYLACRAAGAGDKEEAGHWNDLGRRGLLVHGMLYAFSRTAGEAWHVAIQNQRLVLDQFDRSPVLFLTATEETKEPNRRRGVSAWCLVKKDGRTIYQQSFKDGEPFRAVHVDRQGGIVEYVGPKEMIAITPLRHRSGAK